jgi:hypothetical protein
MLIVDWNGSLLNERTVAITNQTLTVWQRVTVEFNGHSLSGSYAVENGVVKVKTPFGEKTDSSSPFNSMWVARRLLEELATEGKL